MVSDPPVRVGGSAVSLDGMPACSIGTVGGLARAARGLPVRVVVGRFSVTKLGESFGELLCAGRRRRVPAAPPARLARSTPSQCPTGRPFRTPT
jgi:hypothetical protein